MRNLNILCLVVAIVVGTNVSKAQRKVELSSPANRIFMEVSVADEVRWSVWKDGVPVIKDNVAQRERHLDVPLDFLAEGVAYKMTSFTDGPNADTQAMDYRKQSVGRVAAGDNLSMRLVRNGGFAAVLEPLR